MDTIERLTQLKGQRLSTELSEQQRLNAETENQRRLAEIDTEIQRLEIQASEEQIQNLTERSTQLASDNHAAIQALFAALGPVAEQVAAALPVDLANAVDRTFESRQANAAQALEQLERQGIAKSLAAGGPPMPADRQKIWDRQRQFSTATPLFVALSQWVQQSASLKDRRVRIAIAFMLTGRILDAGPDVDWRVMIEMANQIARV